MFHTLHTGVPYGLHMYVFYLYFMLHSVLVYLVIACNAPTAQLQNGLKRICEGYNGNLNPLTSLLEVR